LRRHLGILAAIATCSPAATLGCLGAPDSGPGEEDTAATAEPLYELSTKIWHNHVIPVCWEDVSQYGTERGWVRSAIKGSWDVQSDVDFVGWGLCTSGQAGIHIGVADVAQAPHTNGLGTEISGVSNGMVLNFTFNNWSPS